MGFGIAMLVISKPVLPRLLCEQVHPVINDSYNIVTVEGAAASRVFFHLKAEAVRMGEYRNFVK